MAQRVLLVTVKEFEEIHDLEHQCFDPNQPNNLNETRWIEGLSLILGPESVSEMIGKGPFKIEVAEWLTRRR